MKFLNVYDDCFEVFEFCKAQGWTDTEDIDEWQNNGEELSIFEGDCDMLKLDGEIIHFLKYGDTIFHDAEDYGNTFERIEGILRDYFTDGKEYHYGYYKKFVSNKSNDKYPNTWETWENCNNAIAYRGGCGYSYDILPLRA